MSATEPSIKGGGESAVSLQCESKMSLELW